MQVEGTNIDPEKVYSERGCVKMGGFLEVSYPERTFEEHVPRAKPVGPPALLIFLHLDRPTPRVVGRSPEFTFFWW
jgi:hypothetical protein